MSLVDFVPFARVPDVTDAPVVDERLNKPDAQKAVGKVFKMTSLALGLHGSLGFGVRSNFESAPHDFARINKAADTDSYVKQGLNKYRELLWKENWDIVGERDEAVHYLQERIAYMEYAMGRSFQSLLDDLGDQLVRFGNCFLAKSRGNLAPYFPAKLSKLEGRELIVGYYPVPAETVEIERDKSNKPVKYQQKQDSLTSLGSGSKQPQWKPEDMIHFVMDRKPGRAFGTPFLVSVLDDVIALRQLEEDIQNLVHKELFPLYKYKVGTEDSPAEAEEIERAYIELENLQNEGGLILPERHDVEVIGAQGSSLDAQGYLGHFVNRVVVGLGLSPHHLGILNEGGNRAITDRLDIALYDKIKTYQRYISDMIRIAIFNELLLEGGFDPFKVVQRPGASDRCDFRFREIDVETQVKRENHEIQKWLNNLVEFEEARRGMGLDTEVDESRLFARMFKQVSDGAQSENQDQPENQHGKKSAPSVRQDDDEDLWFESAARLFDDEPLYLETLLTDEDNYVEHGPSQPSED